MKESYLNLMEEHKHEEKVNLFEKVLTMTKRAKSLYSLCLLYTSDAADE